MNIFFLNALWYDSLTAMKDERSVWYQLKVNALIATHRQKQNELFDQFNILTHFIYFLFYLHFPPFFFLFLSFLFLGFFFFSFSFHYLRESSLTLFFPAEASSACLFKSTRHSSIYIIYLCLRLRQRHHRVRKEKKKTLNDEKKKKKKHVRDEITKTLIKEEVEDEVEKSKEKKCKKRAEKENWKWKSREITKFGQGEADIPRYSVYSCVQYSRFFGWGEQLIYKNVLIQSDRFW